MEAMVDEASDVDTKTSMDTKGNVFWKRGDQVSVFAGSTVNEHYQVTDASDGRTAAVLSSVESPGFLAGSEINNNVAFYPYAEAAEIKKSGNTYNLRDIVLPATQYYAEESFGNGAFPMAAVTSSTRDMILKFKNVLGGVKLQLTGTATITSIRVTGNNNEILCGGAEVTVSNTTVPSISLKSPDAKTVTLDCGAGVQLNTSTATTFIIALPPMTLPGGFTITATDSQGKQMEMKTTKSQTIIRSSLLAMPGVTYEGIGEDLVSEPEAVDLGLPSGLKWASCNLCETGFVSSPEEFGDYYAWGDIEIYYTSGHAMNNPCSNWKSGKTGYNWTSYTFGTSKSLTRYCTDSSYGTVDNKTVLEPEDDAAHVNLGGNWRMPTDAEWTELRNECTWRWRTKQGVKGMLVTGSNGNSIFLPAAGNRSGVALHSTDTCGRYWSSSLYTDAPSRACCVRFDSSEILERKFDRIFGQSVRPVIDEAVHVTSVSLNESSLTLEVGGTATLTATVLPENATNKNITWSSENESIATVSSTGVVTAVASGTAVITATTYDGGFTATCIVTVTSPASTGVPAQAVDLGLPSGLKWASCNVGASAPEEYGDYFAWGETEPYYEDGYAQSSSPVWKEGKTGYNWASYKWCNGSYNTQTKYCTNSSYGAVDNKTEFSDYGYVDDVARQTLRGYWRMPTDEEWTELRTECSWTWTTINGVNGKLVTGPNNNSLFLPTAGFQTPTKLYNTGSYGYYGSSSLYTDNPSCVWFVSFNSDEVYRGAIDRFIGLSARPVIDEAVRVTSVSLNETSLTIEIGGTATLTASVFPENATNRNVTWSSENESIATVSSTGVVTAVAPGAAVITATTADGGFTATCNVTVNSPVSTDVPAQAVDLGLTSGLKWASCNVGASAPEEYGDYFAWGETAPYYTAGHSQDDPCSNWENNKTGYNWASYKYELGTDSNGPFSKYVTNSSYGTVDNKTVLDSEDDAAAVNWGGIWRMPTDAEWTELRTECTWTWTTQNGVNGRLVTGPNGNSIFLPAAGYRFYTYLSGAGSDGDYWSSSLYTGSPYGAYFVYFGSSSVSRYSCYRFYGQSVRPVTE